MNFLYLDTSDHLLVGLMDGNYAWKSRIELENTKSSAKIHGMIYEMLADVGIKADQIDGLYISAGPGSYTGMRLSEGIGQIFEWIGIPVFSFYHFEIPWLLGKESGVWFSSAFKGEFFLYSWEKEKSKKKLLSIDEFSSFMKTSSCHKDQVYTHSHGKMNLSNFHDVSIGFTTEIIHESSSVLFPKISELKLRRLPYYYRLLDEEFRIKK